MSGQQSLSARGDGCPLGAAPEDVGHETQQDKVERQGSKFPPRGMEDDGADLQQGQDVGLRDYLWGQDQCRLAGSPPSTSSAKSPGRV